MITGLSMRARAVSIALVACPVTIAWGHPGHEHPVTPAGHPMHWFIEPDHALQALGLLCVACVSYKLGKNLRGVFEGIALRRQKASR